MIVGPKYALEELAARRRNAELFRNNINTPDVELKVRNWAERNGFEYEFVRFKVLTDDTFALQFAKDPSRQSIHEKLAAKHIEKNIPFVEEFAKASTGGADALYVINGMVVLGREVHQSTGNHGKSVDFTWSFTKSGRSLRVFATHKHTKEEGGSQDNQFADVRRFLKEAQVAKNPNDLFLAICDGDYYRLPWDGRKSRIEVLAEDCPGKRLAVCSIDQLSVVYAVAIQQWMTANNLTPTADELETLNRML